MSSHSAPTRTLPNNPSLAQLRKQAKELRKAYRAGQEAAIAQVERFEQKPDPASFALADAQRILARSYGFSSWPALKNHVEGVNFPALIAAAEAGNAAAVRRLAKTRPDVINQHTSLRDSSLRRAVLSRNQELTRVLMQLGADARVGIWPHRDVTSAYAIAVDREYSEIVAAIEREEQNRHARTNQDAASTLNAFDALRQAIFKGHAAEAIALMEADPALIGACDVDGITPLHLAAWKHDPTLVRWLLDRGASPAALASRSDPRCDDLPKSGKTPLDFSAIVAGWAPEGIASFFYFMENVHVDPARFCETARLLLQKGAELTPRAAVALGDREAVLRMHREGRLPNEIHIFRGGLLGIAVRVDRLDMVTTLLDLGLDPNESDGGESAGMPLWFASMCGRHEIAELLLTRGANVDAVVCACGDSMGRAEDEKMKALLAQARSAAHGRECGGPGNRSSDSRRHPDRVLSGWHGALDSQTSGRVPLRWRTGIHSDVFAVYHAKARRSMVERGAHDRQAARGFEARSRSRSRCRYTLRRRLHHAPPPGDAGRGTQWGVRAFRGGALQTRGDAARRWRLVDDPRFAAAIDAARLGLPLGKDPAHPTVPGTRRRPRGGGCGTVGNAFGLGYEARASRNCRTAPLAWHKLTELTSSRRRAAP